MALAAGTRLGSYEIVSTIGAGGMGQVYRARDTRLNRTVAIKVLPGHLALDPVARARFVREGQALAALSHPNLVALYDVGTEAGASFAVMELVDGETLQAKLAAGRLPVRRVVDYGVQIARGLAAAHDKGIVHRDLKPANVIVAADGHVKILDFGLAKPGGETAAGARVSDAETALGTDPGTVMGTVGYMAPEQVRSLATDPRTDLFAFGALLYEMTTGARAFDRESAAETMTAIVKDDPAPIPADLGVPPALERIIRRCLEKRPEDRFRSAADLAFQLETLSSPTGRLDAAATPAIQRPRRRLSIAAAAGIFLAGLLAGWGGLARVLPLRSTAAPAAILRTTMMTYSGRDLLPAVSPDRRTIAFVSGRDGVDKIWLRQLATGEEAALTEGRDTAPRFSPDGATILFARYERNGWSLYRVPVVGGQPRKVLDQAFEGDWSPDGARLAFVRQRPTGDWLVGVAAADGSQIRESPAALTTSLKSPRWSPDSRSVVVVQSGVQATILDQFLVYDAATLTSTALVPTERGGRLSVPVWSGAGTLVYAQSSDVTSYSPESRIVLQHLSGGGRTLAWMPAFVDGLDLLGEGSLIIDTASNRQNLRESEWTTSGLGAGRWLTRGTGSDRQPAYTPDGRVVFSAMRNGNLDLWVTSPATGVTYRLTDDQAQDWDPAFTADGKHLLWSSNRSGHFEIWIAEPDGRNARQLTHDGYDAENPTATPDSQWVVYGAGAEQTQGVWKIRLDGSQATKLVAGPNAHPDVSPDGQYMQYHTNVIGSSQLHVVRVSDGRPAMPPISISAPSRTLAVSVGRGRWRADGGAIVYVGTDANGESCLMEQAFRPGQDTTATRRILQKSELTLVVESFGISRDGKRLTTSFIEDQFAVMRLDGLPGVAKR